MGTIKTVRIEFDPAKNARNIAERGISFERVVRCTVPFLIPLLVVLMLITFFPPVVTWLPNLVMGVR